MNKKTNMKIIWTTIRRVIMSVLFVNLSFGSKVLATNGLPAIKGLPTEQITCYAVGPRQTAGVMNFKNVFIIFVPVALIVGIVVYMVKKHKNKSKKEENDDK